MHQGGPAVRFDAQTGDHREATVLVAQHLFGLTTLQKAPADEGMQDATAQIGLHLRYSGLNNSTGRVQDDARRCDWRGGINVALARTRTTMPS